MSEFNYLIGVNEQNDLPDPVRARLFRSNESSLFRSTTIDGFKPILNSAIDSLKHETNLRVSRLETLQANMAPKVDQFPVQQEALTGRVTNLEKTKMKDPGVGKKDQVLSSDGSRVIWSDRKPGVPVGGRIGQVLKHDGTQPIWEDLTDQIPKNGTKGQVLTKGENGYLQWTTPKNIQNTLWSKDQQAKAQGFWIENSTTPPSKPTYTTDDGTVVPVIWHQPIETLIPTLPTRPYFYPDNVSVGVDSTVGFKYYVDTVEKGGVTRSVKYDLQPGENDLKWIEKVPFTMTIKVRPTEGYKIPSEFQWSMYYPDPEAVRIFGSETFNDRPEDSIIFNTIFGDSSEYWRSNSPNGSEPVYPVRPDSRDYTYGTRLNPQGKNTMVVKEGRLHVGPVVDWYVNGVKTLSPRMSVTIKIDKFASGYLSGWNMNFASSKTLMGGVGVEFGTNGITLAGTGYKTQLLAKVPTVGTYKISVIENRFRVVYPDGESVTTSVDHTEAQRLGNYGEYFAIRSNMRVSQANADLETIIDSIVIENYGL